ncbi:MAG: translocation/assembly module TamB [bacterium]|nr:translocation/assembly module TamB [bacterium]MDD5756913.1 translocation/assembly module TamB [bacterium]
MRKLFKILFIGIIAVIVAGYLLLITPLTQRALKDYVLRKINADTSSIVKVGSVKGGFSGRLLLENVELKMDRLLLTARKISIKYHPNLLIWGHLVIEEMEIDGARIKIYQITAVHKINIPADIVRQDPWLKDLQIRKFSMNSAEIEYSRKNSPPVLFSKVNINASIFYLLINKALKLDITGFSCTGDSPALTIVKSKGEIVSTPYDLRVSGLQIKLPKSTVYLDGAVKDFQAPKIYLHCKSDRFNMSDVPVLKKPAAVFTKPLSFDIVASGDLSMLRWAVRAKSGQTAFSGRGIVDALGLKKHSFTFNGEIAHLNLTEFQVAEFGRTDLNITLQGTGRGNKPWAPEMQMTLNFQDSYFGPYQVFPSEFMLSLNSTTLTAATNLLNTNFGHFVLQGEFAIPDLSAGIAAASVSLKFDQLNLKPFIPSIYLGSNLNGGADLAVQDLKWQDQAKAQWSATLDIAGSSLAKIKIDRLNVEAEWSNRKLNIIKGQLASELADAEINGYYEKEGATDIHCRVEAKDLSLADNIFPSYPVSGQVNFNVHVSGRTENPEADWQLSAKKLRFKKYFLSTLNCAGYYKDKIFDYELALTGRPNQALSLKGLTNIQKTPIETNVELLRIQYLDQIWMNEKIFTLQTDRHYLAVDDLVMGNRGQVIRAQGLLDWQGAFDFSLSIENLQLGYFNESFSADQIITGNLNSFIFISGTAGQPVMKARVEMGDLEIKPVCLEKYTMDLNYQNGQWEMRGLGICQANSSLDLAGTWLYPVNFDRPLPDIWDSNIDLKVKLDKLPLDFMQTIVPAISSAKGFLSSTIEAKGSLRDPHIDILANTTEGSLKFRDLPEPFTALKTKARIHNKKLELAYLLADIENGQFYLAGTGVVEKLQLASFDFALKITNGPIFYPGIFTATVNADGSFKKKGADYALQAEVTALEGIIEIEVTEQEKQADLIFIDDSDQPEDKQQPEEKGPESFYDHLAMDFNIHSEGDVWYKLGTSKAELVGDLRIQKQLKGELTYLGSVRIKQGYYDFLRNRFIITHGELQFPGTAGFNPLLNIDGEYDELSEIVITATVRGDLNNPLIQLRSDPPQKDVEILSYLLFGKSSQNLSNQEASSVESQVLSFIGRSTVLKVRDILGDKLTIDTLDIKKDEDNRDWRISVGKYIGHRLFVSYTFGFSAEAEDKLRLEYKLGRRWNIESEISQTNSAGADLFWTIDY